MANGTQRINERARASCCGPMGQSMRDSGLMIGLLDTAGSSILMETVTMGCGQTIKPMDKALMKSIMVRSMSDNGLMISKMVREPKFGKMEQCLKVTFTMEGKMVMEFSNG